MQFFLHEIAARILAAYLLFDSARGLRVAVAERKISFYGNNSDVIAWLLSWSKQTDYRDTMPIRYWLQFGTQVFAVAACTSILLFGWHAAVRP